MFVQSEISWIKNEWVLKTHEHICTFLWFITQHIIVLICPKIIEKLQCFQFHVFSMNFQLSNYPIITLRTCLNSDCDCSYIKDSTGCPPVISQKVTQYSVSPCNKPEVDTGSCVNLWFLCHPLKTARKIWMNVNNGNSSQSSQTKWRASYHKTFPK